VVLNIRKNTKLDIAIEEMKSNFPGANLIVQPMLPIQTELIIGIKNDPTVGPVIIYGLGGIYTEVFKIVNFLIPPLSLEEVRDSLLKGKLGFLFQETRGQAPYNLEEIAQIILNISALGSEAREIKELDVNPLLVYNNGGASIAVDVKIII
jgi:acetyltransferase